MKLSSFIIVILFPFFSQAADNNPDLDEFRNRCLKQSDVEACNIAVSAFNGQNESQLALEVSEKMCEMDADNCSQSYFSATRVSPQAALDLVKKMQMRCSKKTDYCDTLASIYEERREFPLALEAAKKYFDKFQKGIYPRLVYEYGNDKKTAFDAFLKDCREDNSKCVFALRYIPDHPQYQELLVHAENQCKKEGTASYGATACAILGTLYYKKSNFSKAFELWAYDCAKNQVACMLILGSEKAAANLKLQAMTGFCNYSTTGLAREKTLVNLERKYCEKFKVNKIIPKEMLTTGQQDLTDFLGEQK